MNYAEYKRAAELFFGLGIDVKSDSELARGYFILRLINSLSVESGGNCSVVCGEKFRRILAHYQVAFFVPFQSVREETLRQIDSLCTLLQQNALFTDRSFFVEFSPWIIADWDGYTNLFMEEKFGGKQLIILLKQLVWHKKYVPGQADFSFDPAAFYQTHSDIIAYWETNFKSSEKLFCNCIDQTPIAALPLIKRKAPSCIAQRFEIVLNSRKKSKKVQTAIAVLAICMFLMSYFVILQPAGYPSPEELEGGVSVTPEDAYIFVKSNGTMQLYVNDEVLFSDMDKELVQRNFEDIPIIYEGENK